MFIRVIGSLLALSLLITPLFAETAEVSSFITAEARTPNFWQEVDIVFWQSLPFAALWGHFIDRQLSAFMFPGSNAHWEIIIPLSAMVSFGNALIHARRVTKNERTGDHH